MSRPRKTRRNLEQDRTGGGRPSASTGRVERKSLSLHKSLERFDTSLQLNDLTPVHPI